MQTDSSQLVNLFQQFTVNNQRSIALFRWIGYGLFILVMIDFAMLLIPPDLMNPNWEFQIAGQLVEKSAIPLIALAFIFFGRAEGRKPIEKPVLKALSWLSLIFCILYLLLIPLTLASGVRIFRQNQQTAASALVQQNQQAEQVKQQLQKASAQDLQQLLQQTNPQAPPLSGAADLEQAKQQAAATLDQNLGQLKTKVETEQQQKTQSLVKASIKWSIGALIASVLFFVIGRSKPLRR